MYGFGSRLKVSLFGSSHGEYVGCIFEGLPKGFSIDMDAMDEAMRLRKPSEGIGTQRHEDDRVEFPEGVCDGIICGRYVEIRIRNRNVSRSDYSDLSHMPRPGHADLPAMVRYQDMDMSGGGPFSGRMTAPLVAAGSIASQFLLSKGIGICAYTRSIAGITDGSEYSIRTMQDSRKHITRSADPVLDIRMADAIRSASKDGDSVGGIIECHVEGLPIGLGGMWFDSLDSSIARAMMSIPGVKGVEFGRGFGLAGMRGSESNDPYRISDGKVIAEKNDMGGVVGGMSDGMPLVFRVAVKPTPSVSVQQHSVDLSGMRDCNVEVKGRHDPCIVPRAVQVVEAFTALTVADQYLDYILRR